MDDPKTLEERKALLAKHVAAAFTSGARVESQTETMAVLVYGRRVNHLLHFLLGFVTLGSWWLVWIFLAITGGEKRKVITVDDYGNILEQGQGGSGGSKLPVIGVGVLGLLLLVGIIAVGSSGTEEEPTDQVSIPALATQVASPPTPTLIPTPASTPTPGPSPTPSPRFTPRPTSIPTPTLAEVERAVLWIYVWNNEYGWADVSVGWNPDYIVDVYDFEVHLQAGTRSEMYCNTSAVFPGEVSTTLGCGSFEVSHQNITGVRATVLRDEHFRCERNETSANQSVFACARR